MGQVDVISPKVPMLVNVLIELQNHGHSINWNRTADEINIYPAPNQQLADWIIHYYDELKLMLPGQCDAHLAWTLRRFEAPWGANPHLCQRCMRESIGSFNRSDWPEMLDFDEEI